MDLVSATKKITDCIDSATSKEHYESIKRMIVNVEKWCKFNCPWDKTIKGALALLVWQNVNKYQKNLVIKK
jgi:hypothetical protein